MGVLLDQFVKQGWVKIPGAVDEELLAEFRKNAVRKWHLSGRPRIMCVDEVDSVDLFRDVQFSPAIVKALNSIFSKPCFVGDQQLTFNMFEAHPSRKGWHIDANSEVRYGTSYMYRPDYRFAKVGLYFQPNLLEKGGGIDGISGSQLEYSSPTAFGRGLSTIKNALTIKLLEYGVIKPMPVAIAPGDVLIFDSRFQHRSSTPADSRTLAKLIDAARNPDPELAVQKLVMYFNVSESGQESDFMYNAYRRALTERDPSGEVYFSRYLARGFPVDYPQEYVRLCREQGFDYARMPDAVRLFMRKKIDRMKIGVSYR